MVHNLRHLFCSLFDSEELVSKGEELLPGELHFCQINRRVVDIAFSPSRPSMVVCARAESDKKFPELADLSFSTRMITSK